MASSNKNVVPEARAALDKFKMEAASEKGVPLDIKALKPLIIKAFRNDKNRTVGVPLH